MSKKDTGMTPGTSIVNFEHVSHFITLSNLLNSNKQMLVGPEKRTFQTINLFLVTVRNILFYGLGKFVRLYVLKMRKDKLLRRHFKKISGTLISLQVHCYDSELPKNTFIWHMLTLYLLKNLTIIHQQIL